VSRCSGRKEGEKACFRSQPLQLVDNTTEQHSLVFTGIRLDPEQSALGIIAPLSKISTVQDPEVTVFQQAAFSLLDTTLIVAWIGTS
jgi:hypothetical protein